MSGRIFRVQDRTRWSDVDAAGIVCYGAYLRFFELAETELFREAGVPIHATERASGIWLVRRRVVCDFFRPVLLDQEIEVAVHVDRIGTSSLELGFLAAVMPANELAVESRYVLVCVDGTGYRPRPLPEAVRAGLSAFHLSLTDARTASGYSIPGAGSPSAG